MSEVITVNNCTLYHGDCLEVMPSISTGSVDLVLCDLPYGTTQNKWDSVIPLHTLWLLYQRCCRSSAAHVLTASQPFTSILGASNISLLRYAWVWRKSEATGHLNAKRMPMKNFEDILVFHDGKATYNPQGLQPYGKMTRRGNNGTNFGKSGTENFQEWTNYPRSVLEFASDPDRTHPTQKPVALMEYLIRTYTNEGDLVLDNAMGSGTTGVACVNTNRRFIGIEKDEEYFTKSVDRIRAAISH